MDRESVAEQWSTLLNYKQSKYKDVFDYYFAEKRLCDNLKLSFSETKSQIMLGLCDRELTFLLCCFVIWIHILCWLIFVNLIVRC